MMDGQASPQLISAQGYYHTAYMRSDITNTPSTSRRTLSKRQEANREHLYTVAARINVSIHYNVIFLY